MEKAILLIAILFGTCAFGQSYTFSGDVNTGIAYHNSSADLIVNGKKVDAKEYDIVVTIKAKKDLDKLMKLLKQLEKEGYEFELKINETPAQPEYSIWGNRTELINTPLHQTPNKIVEGY
jgi:hypothetical protein